MCSGRAARQPAAVAVDGHIGKYKIKFFQWWQCTCSMLVVLDGYRAPVYSRLHACTVRTQKYVHTYTYTILLNSKSGKVPRAKVSNGSLKPKLRPNLISAWVWEQVLLLRLRFGLRLKFYTMVSAKDKCTDCNIMQHVRKECQKRVASYEKLFHNLKLNFKALLWPACFHDFPEQEKFRDYLQLSSMRIHSVN